MTNAIPANDTPVVTDEEFLAFQQTDPDRFRRLRELAVCQENTQFVVQVASLLYLLKMGYTQEQLIGLTLFVENCVLERITPRPLGGS